MTETLQYQPAPSEVAIRSWVLAAIEGVISDSDVPVIYSHQTQIRLKRPFVQIQVISDNRQHEMQEVLTDELLGDGTYRVDLYDLSVGTVQVRAYGSQAYRLALAIRRSLERQDVLHLNTRNNLQVQRPVTAILDVPEATDVGWEPSRTQDFQFQFAECVEQQIRVVSVDGDEVETSLGDGAVEEVVATSDDISGASATIEESAP